MVTQQQRKIGPPGFWEELFGWNISFKNGGGGGGNEIFRPEMYHFLVNLGK